MEKLVYSFVACHQINWYKHFGWLLKARVTNSQLWAYSFLSKDVNPEETMRRKKYTGAENCSLQHKLTALHSPTHILCLQKYLLKAKSNGLIMV